MLHFVTGVAIMSYSVVKQSMLNETFFYLRWHVFNSAKKENETIGRNDIGVDHVTG